MSALIKIENLKELIIEIRDENVLLDSDVAVIYGVETKRINEAVKNNPEKFPPEYMFELSEAEFVNFAVENFDRKICNDKSNAKSLY